MQFSQINQSYYSNTFGGECATIFTIEPDVISTHPPPLFHKPDTVHCKSDLPISDWLLYTYLYHPLEHVSEGKVRYVDIGVVEHAVYL